MVRLRRSLKKHIRKTEVPPRAQRHGWSYGEAMRAAFMGVLAVSFIACEQRVQLSGEACDALTCNGCCTPQGCVSSALQSDTQCGSLGSDCIRCLSGTACSAGSCRPLPTCGSTCAGCCDGSTCVPWSQQNLSRCGNNGAACGACTTGTTCSSGACQPVTSQCGVCAGCCDGLFGCNSGTGTFTCGKGGELCKQCGHLENCIDGRCEKCGPTNCAGCCFGGQCVAGDADITCGHGGATCENCPFSTKCTGGSCQ